jgi:hypothetical protein
MKPYAQNLRIRVFVTLAAAGDLQQKQDQHHHHHHQQQQQQQHRDPPSPKMKRKIGNEVTFKLFLNYF